MSGLVPLNRDQPFIQTQRVRRTFVASHPIHGYQSPLIFRAIGTYVRIRSAGAAHAAAASIRQATFSLRGLPVTDCLDLAPIVADGVGPRPVRLAS